ncbi:hypothetical protein Tco_0117289 [Tanacetum coccineum]
MPFGLILWFLWCVTFLFGSGGSFSSYVGSGVCHHFFHGLWNVFIEAFCQLRVVNPMHESEDSHALRGPFHASSFNFEPLHEIHFGSEIRKLHSCPQIARAHMSSQAWNPFWLRNPKTAPMRAPCHMKLLRVLVDPEISFCDNPYKPKTQENLSICNPHLSLSKTLSDVIFFMERGTSPSPGWFSWSFNDSNSFSQALHPTQNPGSSSTPIYSPGASTTPIYSPGSSSTLIYSPGALRNAECSNCKHLLDKITVLEAMLEMYKNPEQHTLNSAALLHEVYNDMGKLDLE